MRTLVHLVITAVPIFSKMSSGTHELKVGYPSSTPLKGTIISAKCIAEDLNKPKNQDFCVPPHVVVFKHPSQENDEVACVQAKWTNQVAGISVSGILSPKNAREFEDADGRFAIVFAGQARLMARKQKLGGKTDSFKMLDEVWVGECESGKCDCTLSYNDNTTYHSPCFYDHHEENTVKLGTVIGVTPHTDLVTIELMPNCSSPGSEPSADSDEESSGSGLETSSEHGSSDDDDEEKEPEKSSSDVDDE